MKRKMFLSSNIPLANLTNHVRIFPEYRWQSHGIENVQDEVIKQFPAIIQFLESNVLRAGDNALCSKNEFLLIYNFQPTEGGFLTLDMLVYDIEHLNNPNVGEYDENNDDETCLKYELRCLVVDPSDGEVMNTPRTLIKMGLTALPKEKTLEFTQEEASELPQKKAKPPSISYGSYHDFVTSTPRKRKAEPALMEIKEISEEKEKPWASTLCKPQEKELVRTIEQSKSIHSGFFGKLKSIAKYCFPTIGTDQEQKKANEIVKPSTFPFWSFTSYLSVSSTQSASSTKRPKH